MPSVGDLTKFIFIFFPGIFTMMTINYLADVELSEFEYTVYSAICAIVIYYLSVLILISSTYIVGKIKGTRKISSGFRLLRSTEIAWTSQIGLISIPVTLAFSAAIVYSTQDDTILRIANSLKVEKLSNRDPLKLVLSLSGGDEIYRRFDVRSPFVDMPPLESDNRRKPPFVEISLGEGVKYSGFVKLYPTKLDGGGVFLGRACKSDGDKPYEKVLGPGVYIDTMKIDYIEFIDDNKSDCAKLF